MVRLLLSDDTKVEGEEEREALRDAVLANFAQLLDQIPKDVEFTYNDNMDKLRPLLGSSFVPYTTLLETLHLPKVHANFDKCFYNCDQKQSCGRIRETKRLVDLMAEDLGRGNKVFEGMTVTLIGSTREGSRVFYHDEVDVHLSLSEEFKEFAFFDPKDQALKR